MKENREAFIQSSRFDQVEPGHSMSSYGTCFRRTQSVSQISSIALRIIIETSSLALNV